LNFSFQLPVSSFQLESAEQGSRMSPATAMGSWELAAGNWKL